MKPESELSTTVFERISENVLFRNLKKKTFNFCNSLSERQE